MNHRPNTNNGDTLMLLTLIKEMIFRFPETEFSEEMENIPRFVSLNVLLLSYIEEMMECVVDRSDRNHFFALKEKLLDMIDELEIMHRDGLS